MRYSMKEQQMKMVISSKIQILS